MDKLNSSRTSFAIKNLLSAFVLQLITVIANMITIKLFIECYGSSTNGLISTITQILSYIMLIESGLGVASIQALYEPLANKNIDKVNSILSATCRYYKKTGKYFLFILVGVACIYPLFINSNLEYIEVNILILIMSLPTIIDYFLQAKIRVLITASQKTYILNFINLVSIVLSAGIRIFFILRGANVLVVQLIYGLISLFKLFLLYFYFNKNYKWVSFKSIPDNSSLNKRWAALVHQLAGLVVNGGPVLIIATFCGLEEASVFSLYNLIFTTITNFMWIFANAVTPGFGEIITVAENNVIKSVYSRFESLFYICLFSVYTILFLLITPFIKLYTINMNDINYVNELLPFMFMIVNILNCLRIPANNIINATGEFSNTQKQAVFESFLNITVSLFLIKFIGIYAVLVGGIISFSYRSFEIVSYVNKKIIPKTIKLTLYRILINILTSLFICIVLKNIIIQVINSWLWLFLISIFIGLVVSIIFISVNYFFDKETLKINLIIFKDIVSIRLKNFSRKVKIT